MAFPYRKILCPIDFDDNSMRALDSAIELARHFGATIFLVHVVPLLLQFSDVPIPFDLYEEEDRATKARLKELGAQKLAGIDYRLITYSGDVGFGILEAIDKYNPDLLVMATHGRKGLAHLFLGSVAETVVRKASCPVLTIQNVNTYQRRQK
jgi:nucleotide-binding universal stress UspA family protein